MWLCNRLCRQNEWHCAVAVYDGSAISLYLDGALQGRQEAGGHSDIVTDPLMIGANFAAKPERHFRGWIDEFGMVRRAWNLTEVQACFEAGRPE